MNDSGPIRESRQLRLQLHETGANFLKTDLDVALTFTQIASEARGNVEKKNRNQANARHAFDTVSDLLSRASLNAADDRAIHDKLGRLKLELQALGEVF